MKDPRIAQMEKYEDREDWPKAIELNKKLLAANPNSHWLLANLSSNYYEARQYKTALKYAEKALKIAPTCPMVLWDYAGTLDMLGQTAKARSIWKGLVKRGARTIAGGECGEGIRQAESLLNDCRYSLGVSYEESGEKKEAARYYKDHLKHRKPGLPSLYTMAEVKKRLRGLQD
jgi:tetratricopeptide (TPR) repeat protein